MYTPSSTVLVSPSSDNVECKTSSLAFPTRLKAESSNPVTAGAATNNVLPPCWSSSNNNFFSIHPLSLEDEHKFIALGLSRTASEQLFPSNTNAGSGSTTYCLSRSQPATAISPSPPPSPPLAADLPPSAITQIVSRRQHHQPEKRKQQVPYLSSLGLTTATTAVSRKHHASYTSVVGSSNNRGLIGSTNSSSSSSTNNITERTPSANNWAASRTQKPQTELNGGDILRPPAILRSSALPPGLPLSPDSAVLLSAPDNCCNVVNSRLPSFTFTPVTTRILATESISGSSRGGGGRCQIATGGAESSTTPPLIASSAASVGVAPAVQSIRGPSAASFVSEPKTYSTIWTNSSLEDPLGVVQGGTTTTANSGSSPSAWRTPAPGASSHHLGSNGSNINTTTTTTSCSRVHVSASPSSPAVVPSSYYQHLPSQSSSTVFSSSRISNLNYLDLLTTYTPSGGGEDRGRLHPVSSLELRGRSIGSSATRGSPGGGDYSTGVNAPKTSRSKNPTPRLFQKTNFPPAPPVWLPVGRSVSRSPNQDSCYNSPPSFFRSPSPPRLSGPCCPPLHLRQIVAAPADRALIGEEAAVIDLYGRGGNEDNGLNLASTTKAAGTSNRVFSPSLESGNNSAGGVELIGISSSEKKNRCSQPSSVSNIGEISTTASTSRMVVALSSSSAKSSDAWDVFGDPPSVLLPPTLTEYSEKMAQGSVSHASEGDTAANVTSIDRRRHQQSMASSTTRATSSGSSFNQSSSKRCRVLSRGDIPNSANDNPEYMVNDEINLSADEQTRRSYCRSSDGVAAIAGPPVMALSACADADLQQHQQQLLFCDTSCARQDLAGNTATISKSISFPNYEDELPQLSRSSMSSSNMPASSTLSSAASCSHQNLKISSHSYETPETTPPLPPLHSYLREPSSPARYESDFQHLRWIDERDEPTTPPPPIKSVDRRHHHFENNPPAAAPTLPPAPLCSTPCVAAVSGIVTNAAATDYSNIGDVPRAIVCKTRISSSSVPPIGKCNLSVNKEITSQIKPTSRRRPVAAVAAAAEGDHLLTESTRILLMRSPPPLLEERLPQQIASSQLRRLLNLSGESPNLCQFRAAVKQDLLSRREKKKIITEEDEKVMESFRMSSGPRSALKFLVTANLRLLKHQIEEDVSNKLIEALVGNPQTRKGADVDQLLQPQHKQPSPISALEEEPSSQGVKCRHRRRRSASDISRVSSGKRRVDLGSVVRYSTTSTSRSRQTKQLDESVETGETQPMFMARKSAEVSRSAATPPQQAAENSKSSSITPVLKPDVAISKRIEQSNKPTTFDGSHVRRCRTQSRPVLERSTSRQVNLVNDLTYGRSLSPSIKRWVTEVEGGAKKSENRSVVLSQNTEVTPQRSQQRMLLRGSNVVPRSVTGGTETARCSTTRNNNSCWNRAMSLNRDCGEMTGEEPGSSQPNSTVSFGDQTNERKTAASPSPPLSRHLEADIAIKRNTLCSRLQLESQQDIRRRHPDAAVGGSSRKERKQSPGIDVRDRGSRLMLSSKTPIAQQKSSWTKAGGGGVGVSSSAYRATRSGESCSPSTQASTPPAENDLSSSPEPDVPKKIASVSKKGIETEERRRRLNTTHNGGGFLKQRIAAIEALGSTCTQPGVSVVPQAGGGLRLVLQLDPVEIVPRKDIHLLNLLSEGTFGKVHRALIGRDIVAVKVSRVDAVDSVMSLEQLRNFQREANACRRIRHPRIVQYLGVCVEAPRFLSIVMTLVDGVNVFDLLFDNLVPVPPAKRLQMARQVIEAVEYLHSLSPVIVHRDLKTPNLLVDKNFNVTLCDFGKTRFMHNEELILDDNGGSPRYMAPECFVPNGSISEKADIWSLACCLIEIFGGPIPYEEFYNNDRVIQRILTERKPPLNPSWFHPKLRQILAKCFSWNSVHRPTIGEIKDTINSLMIEDIASCCSETRRIR